MHDVRSVHRLNDVICRNIGLAKVQRILEAKIRELNAELRGLRDENRVAETTRGRVEQAHGQQVSYLRGLVAKLKIDLAASQSDLASTRLALTSAAQAAAPAAAPVAAPAAAPSASPELEQALRRQVAALKKEARQLQDAHDEYAARHEEAELQMEEQRASLQVKLCAAEDELNAERQAAAEVLERVRAEEAAKAAQAVALAKAEAAELAKKLAAAELNAAQVKAAFEKVAAQTVERRLKEIEDQRLRHEADLVATRADERRRLERVLAERAPSAAAAAPESAPRAKRNRS